MKKCECCGQILTAAPLKKRNRWAFLKSLKAGEVMTFLNERDKEQARDAARHYNIPYKAYKHRDGSGYSLIISS